MGFGKYMDNTILQERRDLQIIGCHNVVPIYSDNGLVLQISVECGELVYQLFIDEKEVMTTKIFEHSQMKNAVEECPENARVFIGGLGFGLILLYLAESKKAKEVIMCEIDQRVIDKFGGTITNYLKENYPDFNLKIIKGDTYEEIKNHGLFDWIYFDLSDLDNGLFTEAAKTRLTLGGKQTHFMKLIKQYGN